MRRRDRKHQTEQKSHITIIKAAFKRRLGAGSMLALIELESAGTPMSPVMSSRLRGGARNSNGDRAEAGRASVGFAASNEIFRFRLQPPRHRASCNDRAQMGNVSPNYPAGALPAIHPRRRLVGSLARGRDDIDRGGGRGLDRSAHARPYRL